MSSKEKIKVGIVGCGFRGRGVAKNIFETDRFSIEAVADISGASLSRIDEEMNLKGVKHYHDHKKLLEMDELQAVFVLTPQFTHKKIVLDSFEAGKNVYCEKPMAISVEDCDEMIAAGEKAGKILMVGQQMRYHAHLNKMKSIISSGEIGKPQMAYLKEFRNTFPGSMKWVFDKEKSGGALMDKSCHHFDVFNWFLDSAPVRVFCSGGQDVVEYPFGVKSELLDNAWVVIDYDNGARAMLGLCMFAGIPYKYECGVGVHMREIAVIGDKGMLRTEGFDLGRNVEVRYSDSRNSVIHNISTEKNIPSAYNRTGNEGILIRFHECVRKGIQPEASGEIGKMAVAIALAAEKSAEEKRPVLLSEIIEK